MELRSYKKKYTSLVLSSALHGLLLFLFLYTRIHQDTAEFVPMRHNPAEVSFYLPSMHSPQAQQMAQEQPTMQKQSSVSPTNAVSQPQPIVTNREPHLSDHLVRQNDLIDQPSSISGEVSPAGFMQAFHAAVKDEREGKYANNGSESSKIPLHVQERLKQWGEISYIQKINEALLQASRRFSRTIHSNRLVQKQVVVTITILKNGSIGTVSYEKLSGIPEVDTLIKELIQSIEFAPIPDRYNTNTYVFPLRINVTLREGPNPLRMYLV